MNKNDNIDNAQTAVRNPSGQDAIPPASSDMNTEEDDLDATVSEPRSPVSDPHMYVPEPAPSASDPHMHIADCDGATALENRERHPPLPSDPHMNVADSNDATALESRERHPPLPSDPHQRLASDDDATLKEDHDAISDCNRTVPASTDAHGGAPFTRAVDHDAETVEVPTGRADAPTNVRPPMKLGKYELLEELGRGGMGSVYKSHHPDLDIPVAIKTIIGSYADDEEYVERFTREARLATKLASPHVVRVYDAGRDENIHYIVQEYIDGDNLLNLISKSPGKRIDANQAIGIIIDVVKALTEAEKLQIIHRDIKPSNIMMTKEGVPKLVDLGLAKRISDDETDTHGPANILLTKTGSYFGSPGYIAPEQVLDTKSVDHRADIYALGATFYHMVTGKLPFHGRRAKDIMMKRIYEDTPDPRKSNRNLPEVVCSIITRMMQKDPVDRYQTSSALMKDLIAAQQCLTEGQQKGERYEKLLALINEPPADTVAAVADDEEPDSTPLSVTPVAVSRRGTPLLVAALIIVPILAFVFLPGRTSKSTSTPALGGRSTPAAQVSTVRETFTMTRTMLNEVSAKVGRSDVENDSWSSSPLILTLAPMTESSDAAVAALWSDDLLFEVQNATGFPVVDRQSLADILFELELKNSDLSDQAALLKLRKLLPASILLKATAKTRKDETVLFIRIINVQTSEIVGLVKKTTPAKSDALDVIPEIATEIQHILAEKFPLKGRLVSGNVDEYVMNVGSYHGVTVGRTFAVYPQDSPPSAPVLAGRTPAATAIVEVVEPFTSVIRFEGGTAEIAPDMLVLDAAYKP